MRHMDGEESRAGGVFRLGPILGALRGEPRHSARHSGEIREARCEAHSGTAEDRRLLRLLHGRNSGREKGSLGVEAAVRSHCGDEIQKRDARADSTSAELWDSLTAALYFYAG